MFFPRGTHSCRLLNRLPPVKYGGGKERYLRIFLFAFFDGQDGEKETDEKKTSHFCPFSLVRSRRNHMLCLEGNRSGYSGQERRIWNEFAEMKTGLRSRFRKRESPHVF